MATAEKQTVRICSKCKKNPAADQDGTNPWCKDCRAAYQREYSASLEDRAERRGLRRGIDAMRDAAAANLKFYGGAHFSGIEAAALVKRMPGPIVEGEKTL